jgi:hypothetical protein
MSSAVKSISDAASGSDGNALNGKQICDMLGICTITFPKKEKGASPYTNEYCMEQARIICNKSNKSAKAMLAPGFNNVCAYSCKK